MNRDNIINRLVNRQLNTNTGAKASFCMPAPRAKFCIPAPRAALCFAINRPAIQK